MYLQNENIENDNYNLGKIHDRITIKIDDKIYNCLLFELLGDSLDNIINNIDLKLPNIKYIIKELLNSLNILYKSNILHGDLKLDNILLANLSNNFINFTKDIKNLNLYQKYDILLKQNLPPEYYSAPKNKRKLKKKKNKK